MNRLKEPSTWAGFAAIFQALGFLFPAHALIINVATAAAGGVAVAMREQGGGAGGAGEGNAN